MYRGSKSPCAYDDYITKNTQHYFKQFQSLTMITQLELAITDGVSVSLASPWPWRSAAKQSDWASSEARKTCFVIMVLSVEERTFLVHRDFLITLYVRSNIEARSSKHCRLGRAISITYSECVSAALVIQHEKRMSSIILPSVASRTLPYFPPYLPNETLFSEEDVENKTYMF
jgi:predicted nucleic acid binding AN1-type Zn finger protein